MMKAFAFLMATVLVIAGCSAVSAPPPQTASPAPGAAQPGAVGARLLEALQPLSPAEAIARGDRWGIPGVAISCVGSDPEDAVLACQWGPGYNMLFDGRMLFWREAGVWKGQPYPPDAVRGVGYFERVFRRGSELIVVMNVASGLTMGTSQVQLLQLGAAGWAVAWVPAEGDWTRGHATVTFDTFDRFTVDTDSYHLPGFFAESNAGDHRPFREEWVRDATGYRRESALELPSDYGAVVHFVTALVNGDDAEAARWASRPELVAAARALGMGGLAPGCITVRDGSSHFRLETGSVRPVWSIGVTQQDDRWVVSQVDSVP